MKEEGQNRDGEEAMSTPAGLYSRLTGFRRMLVGDAAPFLDRQVLYLSTAPSPSSTSPAKKQRDTLGRRLLSLVYPKRSAVITLRQWVEEGRNVRKYELNRIVRELRKHKRFKHALEVCNSLPFLSRCRIPHLRYFFYLLWEIVRFFQFVKFFDVADVLWSFTSIGCRVKVLYGQVISWTEMYLLQAPQ